MTEPVAANEAPISIPKRNGPNEAIAAVQPITPPAWRGSKIIGICLKVLALPTPLKKNTPSINPTNMGNSAIEVGWV